MGTYKNDVWHENYNDFKSYFKETGRTPSSGCKSRSGIDLGNWFKIQKCEYKKDNLTKERLELLQKITPLDTKVRYNLTWDENYKNLEIYFKKTGKIPTRIGSSGTARDLARWLAGQRRLFRRGTLEIDKKQLLDKLIFFESNPQDDATWHEKFNVFKSHFEKTGKTSGKGLRSNCGKSLIPWIGYQRRLFKAGKLRDDRVKLLEEITSLVSYDTEDVNMIFNASWNYHFEVFKTYFSQTQKQPVEGLIIDGAHVGTWANNNRILFRAGKVSPDRIEIMRSSGFEFDPKMDKWISRAKLLSKYIKDHGSPPELKEAMIGFRFGQWVRSNFRMYLNGQLTNQQRKILESLKADFYYYDVKI